MEVLQGDFLQCNDFFYECHSSTIVARKHYLIKWVERGSCVCLFTRNNVNSSWLHACREPKQHFDSNTLQFLLVRVLSLNELMGWLKWKWSRERGLQKFKVV